MPTETSRRNIWGIRYFVLCFVFSLTSTSASAQQTPYIGYVYPAGGQQATTVDIKLGGQRLDGLKDVVVSGSGVTAKIVKFYRKMNNQEAVLLREQAKILNPRQPRKNVNSRVRLTAAEAEILRNIQARMVEYNPRPASASISELVYIQVTIAADAKPGPREIRLISARGITNPMEFYVGQIPEVAREPMRTSVLQVLGKEEAALRKRPADEAEMAIELPCTVNGQIASGEVNWYRFEASKGQRLVLSCAARQLIPYIADAVPGWFQPVMSLYDNEGKQVAYNDDFRFKPDPTIFFEVPSDGEYRVKIHDAIYRGREDFVYRISIGELPMITSIFPLGGSLESIAEVQLTGWNLQGAKLSQVNATEDSTATSLSASVAGVSSNRMPYAISRMNESFESEPNNTVKQAEKVQMPTIVNGRIEQQGDSDVFAINAKAGQMLVAEVTARRLDSPLDSMLKITDADGNVIALNDDYADVASGLNTHHADSYIMVKIPQRGVYYVHIGDTSHRGGEAYAYRLRLSGPRPDFELRTQPSGLAFRSKKAAGLNVFAIRKDGFEGDIRVRVGGWMKGFTSGSAVLKAGEDMTKMWIKTARTETESPVKLSIQGVATIGGKQVFRRAVASEDKMQAFLWRHLVTTEGDCTAIVFKPRNVPDFKRELPPPPTMADKRAAESGAPPQFTERQVQGRLRQLRLLYDDWMLTDNFYTEKVAQCETVQ
ncbi:hypothetical protein CA13_12960 [Planctomycetes bacterium CA13]|uniref:Ig-like domain-containing protein n=1 Tax=Novipirellula herctigrandis TaxID=2527986 RepID=A0A5C5YXT5_9BACT|nr:hypothetical protein CA13_12960 [Planctomycetes bacterium CA13]